MKGSLGRMLAICVLPLAACDAEQKIERSAWTLERELSIGNEESTEYALTRVAAISVDDAGNMYVAQPQDRTIRVFTADGSFVRYIGRSGAGPGEFDQLVGSGLRGDTLWASDATSVVRFTLEGDLVRDDAVLNTATDDPRVRTSAVDYLLPDGSYAMGVSFMPTNNPDDWPAEIPMYVRNAAGELTHQLGAFSLETIRMYRASNGMPRIVFSPFQRLFLYTRAPDGSAYVFIRQQAATSEAIATFRGVRTGFRGDTLFARDVEYLPTLVSDAARDSVIQAITGDGENRQSAEDVRARLEVAPIPDYYPPVQAAIVGSDDSIWLHMQGTPQGEWLVLDSAGNTRARVTGPLGLQILAADADRVWGVELDAYDVPSIVRYRIVR